MSKGIIVAAVLLAASIGLGAYVYYQPRLLAEQESTAEQLTGSEDIEAYIQDKLQQADLKTQEAERQLEQLTQTHEQLQQQLKSSERDKPSVDQELKQAANQPTVTQRPERSNAPDPQGNLEAISRQSGLPKEEVQELLSPKR